MGFGVSSNPISYDDIINYVNKYDMIDLLIFSGGETLMHSDVVDVVRYIRNNVDVDIRIDTNGLFYTTAKQLVDDQLVDGFAVDIKYPVWKQTGYQEIYGVDNIDIGSIMNTIKLADGMKSTLFRTVKYPCLTKQDLDDILVFVGDLKSPHYVNPYITF